MKKKIISVLFCVTTVFSMTCIASAQGIPASEDNAYAASPLVSSEDYSVHTSVTDLDGKLIEDYTLGNALLRAFPCCESYPTAGLTRVTVWTHVVVFSTGQCTMKYQNCYMCNACEYIAISDSAWKSGGTHNINTTPGKNNCPF